MPATSAGRDARRSSRSGTSGSDAPRSTTDRREKAKSSQSYSAAYNEAANTRRGSLQPTETRRGSVQPSLGSIVERPKRPSRTNSAPLGDLYMLGAQPPDPPVEYAEQELEATEFAPQAAEGAMWDGQDEDEVAGVVGAVSARKYSPFRSSEVAETLQEINIAIIGAEGVGKSTFVQKAFDLDPCHSSLAAERRIPVDGSAYLVRLLEVPIDDVYVDDDDTVGWPDTIEDKVMPRIDGAIAMYDVQDKGSFDDVPEVLTAITKALLPSVLVSAKCDRPVGERELDPTLIEQKARRSISGIGTLQSSDYNTSDSQKQAISMILKLILFGSPEDHTRSISANRRRAQSTAVRPVSPHPPNGRGHVRASSEYMSSAHNLVKDQRHARHDSSLASYGASNALRVPKESQESMNRSFLFEESPSESSVESDQSPMAPEQVPPQTSGGAPSPFVVSEKGATFDELVERLLAQPASKTDSKFCAIFLALYRKFAAPSRLLEAIIERFDAFENDGAALMLRTVNQLRYLAILEQWVGQYPGDFEFPRTKQRMRAFAARIAQSGIFAAAAKEISNHLEIVQEDDDTNWCYSDRDREVMDDSRASTVSVSSTMIDYTSFNLTGQTSGTTLTDDRSTITTVGTGTVHSNSGSSTTSSQILLSSEAAQRVAKSLQPSPRQTITKEQWRELDEQPDDMVAKELTRMDWIMFSSIRPRDLVRHVSNAEKARCSNLVNVNRMIEHFNYISSWVTNYILLRDKPKHRALMLEKLMRIARKLRELNNYNALGAIIAGIKSSCVQRLAATRELIPPSMGKDWARLELLMGSTRSHAAYRLAWDNSTSERIPYLPLHLRDLASAEQGNPTFVGDERNGRVNWKKFEVMGEVVVSMQRAQGMPYRGLGGSKGEAQIKELILDVKLRDEDALYERSIQLEPSPGTGGTSAAIKHFFKR